MYKFHSWPSGTYTVVGDITAHTHTHTEHLFLYIYKFISYLFIFGCIGSSLLRVSFLCLQRAGSTLCCGARASHCGGFSCCGARALGTRASVVVACGLSTCGSRALEHRLSSCDAQTELLWGMWDPPGPGLEPVSPALAGGFPTTAPPGKPTHSIFINTWFYTNTMDLLFFFFWLFSLPVKFDMCAYIPEEDLQCPVTLRISKTLLFVCAQNEDEPVLLKVSCSQSPIYLHLQPMHL